MALDSAFTPNADEDTQTIEHHVGTLVVSGSGNEPDDSAEEK